jgi:hypothetical protein
LCRKLLHNCFSSPLPLPLSRIKNGHAGVHVIFLHGGGLPESGKRGRMRKFSQVVGNKSESLLLSM